MNAFLENANSCRTGLIILGIVIDLGGGPNHDRLGFRYWKNPGPFVDYNGITGSKGHFLGWWAVMTQAAFSFIGTEIVAVSIDVYITSIPRHDHWTLTRSQPERQRTQGGIFPKPSSVSTSVSSFSTSEVLPSSACSYPRITRASHLTVVTRPDPLSSLPSRLRASKSCPR